MLSDSEAETDDVHTLTINEHYAKAFQYKKEREELVKLKEKYGSDISDVSAEGDSEDSDDTSEDSDGVELTPAVDAAILRTLARIKKKDPNIYDGGRQVFDEEEGRTKHRAPLVKAKTKDKSKPLTIRQAALAAALEDGEAPSRSPSPPPLTHVEEQSILQSEMRAVFHSAVDSLNKGDDVEDDLLIPRSRTRDEVEQEEEEYKAFLEREVGEELRELITGDVGNTTDRDQEIASSKEDQVDKKDRMKRKKEKLDAKGDKESKKSKKSKEDEDHEFLLNYIFNRGWIDRTNRRIPTYAEIVNSSKPSKSTLNVESETKDEEQGPTFSDEESFDDLADAFESSYNFRFEEPDGALIPSHPRNVPSVRRESTTRQEARQRKKERKDAEKKEMITARKEEIRRERDGIEKRLAHELAEEPGHEEENIGEQKKLKQEGKKGELARLKDLQTKDLLRKLERVSAEGGLKGVDKEALVGLDLDAPWDPEKHDKHMAALYATDDFDNDADVEKPTWDDDIDTDDIIPPTGTMSKEELKKIKKREKKKAKRKRGDSDEEDGVDIDAMDVDADGGDWEEADGEEWDGTEEMRKRKVDQYMEEVVNRLGFNDITAHIPTRFHYIQTAADDYGLLPAEILLAKDAELNSYVGLKKMAPYRRTGASGKGKDWDPKRNERLKEFRQTLQARIGSGYSGGWSIGADGRRTGDGAENGKKKRLGKKERAKLKDEAGDKAAAHGGAEQPLGGPMDRPSKKREYEDQAPGISEESRAPQKKRRRHRKKATSNSDRLT